MTRRIGWILVALAVALAGSAWAQPCESDYNRQNPEAAINDLWAQYKATSDRNDFDGWLALWDDQGVKMRPGQPELVGKQAMRENLDWGDAPTVMHIDPQETVVAGAWAYVRGQFSVDMLDTEGAVADTMEGKFLSILKQEPNGCWRLYRDIHNWNASY